MTTDLVNRDGEEVRKGRISPALRTAITLIVSEGLTVADAAVRTGYKPHSLTQALKKPHVKAYRASVKRAWLASETEQAWLTMTDLARRASSEDARFKAAKFMIDVDLQARGAMPEQARQLVQIVTQNVNLTGNLSASQMPGVIEAPAWSPLPAIASNSDPVGRAESEGEDDGE
jgi:hypothetical protein